MPVRCTKALKSSNIPIETLLIFMPYALWLYCVPYDSLDTIFFRTFIFDLVDLAGVLNNSASGDKFCPNLANYKKTASEILDTVCEHFKGNATVR